jgi:hypothetical protein
MNKQVGAEEFLTHHTASNFQVKKIAGKEDLELAKTIIRSRYLLAGTTEQFDEFLVLLAGQLNLPTRLFVYTRQNESRPGDTVELPPGFGEELAKRNRLDAQLYNWVKTELFDDYITRFGSRFDEELESFRDLNREKKSRTIVSGIDFLYRNAYWKPLTGLFRVFHGLPYSGSYRDS